MSDGDNTYCAYAKDAFKDAKEGFNKYKPQKDYWEEALKESGKKDNENEYQRNNILIDLRAKEKDIQEIRTEINELNSDISGIRSGSRDEKEKEDLIEKLKERIKEKESKVTYLEGQRGDIVEALRACEERIRQTRDFIEKARAEHFTASGLAKKYHSQMREHADSVRSNCKRYSDIDLSIPDYD